MLVPSMYDMAEVMTQSGYSEEQVFDCGMSGQIAFVVVVPEIGACNVPLVALSHFMAGADEYTADGMLAHWSGQPSGPWTIKRDRLRILADSWEEHAERCHVLADALERQQLDDEAATLRTPPRTRMPGFYTLEEAARAIAVQEGFNDFQENELRKDLLEGDRDGTLTVRAASGHRKFAPVRPEIPRDFVELVTPSDVNKWAIQNELLWRWQTKPTTDQEEAPAQNSPTTAPVVKPVPPGGTTITDKSPDALASPREMHGHRVWRLSEAIDEIAKALGWHSSQRDHLMTQAVKDATAGDLKVRDLYADGIMKKGDHMSELLDSVFSSDVNEWLDTIGAPFEYRLPEAELPVTERVNDRLTKREEPYRRMLQTTETQPQPLPLVAMGNSTKLKRRDSLSPVIEMAQEKSRNPKDTAEVWAELQVLAEKKQAPLIGATEQGLQYLKDGIAEIFTRESLRKRLRR